MSIILKNEHLEVHIDRPLENYQQARFDWTGNISLIRFHGIEVTTTEKPDGIGEFQFGKGLFNEFGIETALGFKEAGMGEWYHKIGVGALKKTSIVYDFYANHEIRPAEFIVSEHKDYVEIECKSEFLNGFSYQLTKRFHIHEQELHIHYELKNTGNKPIISDEYTHNFFGFKKQHIGPDFTLSFPFTIQPNEFDKIDDPSSMFIIREKELQFSKETTDQYFIGRINGSRPVEAKWHLHCSENKISISESGDFMTHKVNVWGWKHVLSPELFIDLHVAPSESTTWSRVYSFSTPF